MLTEDDSALIRKLIQCLFRNGDCLMRKQLREELKLLFAYLRLKQRRKKVLHLIAWLGFGTTLF